MRNLPTTLLLTVAWVSSACDSSTSTSSRTVSGTVSGLSSSHQIMLLKADGTAVLADIGTDGSFSGSLSPGDWSVAALDADQQPVVLLVQNDATVFEISTDTSLGTLTVDLSSKVMSSTATLTAALTVRRAGTDAPIDLSDMTSVDPTKHTNSDNGVTVSDVMGNGIADSDGDLVPDFLDNDSNQNGTFDNLEGLEPCKVVITQADATGIGVSSFADVTCVLFDNLKLQASSLFDGDGSPLPHTDQHILTFHVGVPTALASLISSVVVTHRPAFAEGTISPAAGNYTFASYPTGGSNWSASSYALPAATDGNGNTAYCLWVTPASAPVPAVFRIRITLTNGTTADFTTRLMFVFNTPPKVTSIDDGTTTTTVTYPVSEGNAGTLTNPLTIGSGASTVTLTADRPIDKAGGVEICGMSVQAHIFYLNSSGAQINVTTVTSPLVVDSGTCASTTDLTLSLDTATYFPTTVASTAVAKYQIDFTVVAPNGDNSAEIFYLSY